MNNPDEKYQVEEYLEHFTKELCQGIQDYALNKALLHSRYIFVETIRNTQYGYCTHCKKEFGTNSIKAYRSGAWTVRGKLKHNSIANCPICMSTCNVKQVGRGRNKLYDRVYFVYYEKSIIDPEAITARGIIVTRDYRENYKEVKMYYETPYLYVFKIGKAVMLKENYLMGYEKRRTVYSGYKNYAFNSNIPLMCCHKSIYKAVENTPFKFSPYKEFITKSSDNKRIYIDDMVDFFSKFTKYPVIEVLEKIGFKKIVDEKINDHANYENAVNWRGKTLQKIFRLTKQDFNILKSFAKKDMVDSMFVKLFQISINDGSKLKPEELKYIKNAFSKCDFKCIEEILSYSKSLKRAYNYLKKQKDKNPKHFYSVSDALSQWKDYIRDCKKLNYNLNIEYIAFPKDLKEEHQKTIKLIKDIADKELDQKIKNRLKELKKYCFEYRGLFIKPAESSKEMIDEGNALDHCVGRYAGDYADGITNIFFVRKVNEPDKPFYTVEISKRWQSGELEIKQCRSYKNHTPEENNHVFVREFMNAFEIEKLSQKENKIIEIPA